MSKSLVSVLTPCYNGAKYIDKLLNSVLIQTYPNIEMFVVDDGSTDDSAVIVKSYIPKFKERGYKLTYIYQEAQGQSVAINRALKLINGSYLVWPDADDYYAKSSSISEMVDILEPSDEETSMVRVQYNILDEEGNLIDKQGLIGDSRYKTDLFEDAIFGANGFWYPPGGYMARVSKIDELIPNREIYTEKNAGQNFQLYLPLLYGHKCLTIEKYLYNVVAHDDSHSRNVATNNNRQQVYYRTIKNTLDSISLPTDYKKYLMKRVRVMTIQNSQPSIPRIPYRIYTKRVVKGILPYGLVVAYKRRLR